MPSKSVAATSAETGPGTAAQISAITSLIGRPALAISGGIGGDAVEQAGGGEFADFANIGGIDEELHGIPPETLGVGGRSRTSGGRFVGLSFSRNRGHRQPELVQPARRFAMSVVGESIVSVLVPVAVAAPYTYRAPAGCQAGRYRQRAARHPRRGGRRLGRSARSRRSVTTGCGPSTALSPRRRLTAEIRRFVDWVADYTLTSRGMVLRMVLRAPRAL